MNKVVHFEIPADDVERASNFYRKTFGWIISKAPVHDREYYLANSVETDEIGMPKEPGAINGAIMKREVEGESPVIVVKVSSIEMYLKKILSSGGKFVLGKTRTENRGYHARFKDTEGNVIGLYEESFKKERV